MIHFLGPPGTGKSHLATALGVEAVKAGRSVYFASLADIISILAKAEREGHLREQNSLPVPDLALSSSTRSDTCPSFPAAAICSSSSSMLATSAAP